MPTEEQTPDQIPESMRAWTFVRAGAPGSVMQFSTDVSIPSLPTESSVLIRVSHTALHPGGSVLIHLVPSLFRKTPSIPETDFSGVVVAVGEQVPTSPPGADDPFQHRYFPPGTAVFGSIPIPSHLKGSGALAEYLVIEVDNISRKPDNISFADAAGLAVSGTTALTLLEEANLKPGQRILLNAPCGGVGHFTCQLAREAIQSAGHIVGVCSSSKEDIAKTLGCDDTLDYNTSADGKTLSSILASRFSGNDAFDVIIDSYGSQPLWHCSPSCLKPGKDHPYVTVGPALGSYTYSGVIAALGKMIANFAIPVWAGGIRRPYKQIVAFANKEKLEALREIVAENKLRTIVGGIWELEDALEAYEKLLSKHAKGKLVIRIWEP